MTEVDNAFFSLWDQFVADRKERLALTAQKQDSSSDEEEYYDTLEQASAISLPVVTLDMVPFVLVVCFRGGDQCHYFFGQCYCNVDDEDDKCVCISNAKNVIAAVRQDLTQLTCEISECYVLHEIEKDSVFTLYHPVQINEHLATYRKNIAQSSVDHVFDFDE